MFLYWMIGFVDTLYIRSSRLQTVTALLLFYTLHSSPLRTHYGSQSLLVVSWQRIYKSHCHLKSHIKSFLHNLIHFLPFLHSHLRLPFPELDQVLDNNSLKWTLLHLISLSFWQQMLLKSKSYCGWRSVSQSVSFGIEHPPGAHDHIFIAPRLLGSCFCVAPSLTRRWVCLLYMLLALASEVFVGS
jgi:hypothetical protein